MHGTTGTRKKDAKTYKYQRYCCSTYQKNRGCKSNKADADVLLEAVITQVLTVLRSPENVERIRLAMDDRAAAVGISSLGCSITLIAGRRVPFFPHVMPTCDVSPTGFLRSIVLLSLAPSEIETVSFHWTVGMGIMRDIGLDGGAGVCAIRATEALTGLFVLLRATMRRQGGSFDSPSVGLRASSRWICSVSTTDAGRTGGLWVLAIRSDVGVKTRSVVQVRVAVRTVVSVARMVMRASFHNRGVWD